MAKKVPLIHRYR